MTGIKTSSDKARAGLDSMVAALEERLERIDALVAEEAAEAEAGPLGQAELVLGALALGADDELA